MASSCRIVGSSRSVRSVIRSARHEQYWLLALWQQSVGSQHHSLRLVTGSVGLRALGQQSVSLQLQSPRLVTSSIGLVAFGSQSVGVQLHSPRFVSGSSGENAPGQQLVTSQHSPRLSMLSVLLSSHGKLSLAVLVCVRLGSVGHFAASFASARH